MAALRAKKMWLRKKVNPEYHISVLIIFFWLGKNIFRAKKSAIEKQPLYNDITEYVRMISSISLSLSNTFQ